MIKKLKKYKFQFLFFALLALVLNPLCSAIFGIPNSVLILINFTLIVIAGILTAERRIPKILTLILGFFTLISVWLEFFVPTEAMCSHVRMWSSLGLFIILAYILIRNFIDAKEINISVIHGAMAGFILLGLVGGVSFEILESSRPGSILLSSESSGYDFYYYSFISLITVGYGDVVPLGGVAKSLSILISLTGQFYMTIGIALFVGKYLFHSNT